MKILFSSFHLNRHQLGPQTSEWKSIITVYFLSGLTEGEQLCRHNMLNIMSAFYIPPGDISARAVFTWVSEVIRVYFSFELLRFVIGLKKLAQLSQQNNGK